MKKLIKKTEISFSRKQKKKPKSGAISKKRAKNLAGMKTGKTLRINEDLERFFSVNLDLLCIADIEGNFIKVNDSWSTLLGYSKDELEKKKFLEFVHPDDLQQTLEEVSNLNEQKKVLNFVNRYRCKDGSYRYLEWRSFPSGKLIFASARDITERMRTEEALEKRIIALTRPLEDTVRISFDELFNIDDIQRLQDEFARTTGVASLITSPGGKPITKPSNFSRLCMNFIRPSEKGYANCMKSDAILGQPKPDGPTIHPCLSAGLCDAGAAILVGGHHIANWLIGQVRNEVQTEENIRKYARELGLDEEEMAKAYNEIPAMSYEQFCRIAQLLYTIANQLSKIAYQNIQQSRFISDKINAETQREAALKALGESERTYRSIINNAPFGAHFYEYRQDDKLIFTGANPAADKILNLKHDLLIGKTIEEAFPGLVQTHIPGAYKKLAAEGGAFFEEQIYYNDGMINGAYEVHAFQITPNNSVAFFIDITKRKQMEEELRKNEEKIRSLFLGAPIGIGLVHNRVFLEVNDTFCNMTGFSKEELIGKSARMLYPSDEEYEFVGRTAYHFPPDSGTKSVETEWKRKDGQLINALLRLTPLNANNLSAGIAFTALDITNQKRNEREILALNTELKKLNEDLENQVLKRTSELKDSLDFSQRVLENTLTGIALFNEVGDLIMTNNALAAILGGTKEKLIGMNYYKIESWRKSGLLDLAMKAIETGKPQQIDVELQTSFHKNVWIDCRFTTFPLGGQKHLLMTANDLTEKLKWISEVKELNKLLQQKADGLEAANKELESFSYSVSHDLRAPLRAIDGFTKILIEDYAAALDPEAKRVCSIIRDNTFKMGHLIDDLLSFSRVGRSELQQTKINMSGLAESIFNELSSIDNSSKIEFIMNTIPDTFGDANLIKQVWTNLISNAIKFTHKKERPIIEIGAENQVNETIYYVKDNGAGFDMRYSNKLFGVFQRLHSTREFEGTGVGLAIVQRIISRHQGRVWAEGEVNKGATVYFTLPNIKGV